MKIIVYNLDAVPVKTQMTGWEIDPGNGRSRRARAAMRKPIRLTERREADCEFERSRSIRLDVCAAHHDGG